MLDRIDELDTLLRQSNPSYQKPRKTSSFSYGDISGNKVSA